MPELKGTITKAEYDGLDSVVRGFYKQNGDSYVVMVTGMVSDADYEAQGTKLAEFRDNNRDLHKENKALKDENEKFKGIDPTKYASMQTELEGLKKQGVKGADDVQTAIQKAVEAAVGPLQAKVDAAEKQRLEAQQRLADKALEDALWGIGAKSGVAEWAREDYINRAKKAGARLDEDGKTITFSPGDSSKPVYSKQRGRITEPMEADEWTTTVLLTEAPGLFKESRGDGHRQNTSRTADGVRVLQNDPVVLGRSIEDIAQGKAVVASR